MNSVRRGGQLARQGKLAGRLAVGYVCRRATSAPVRRRRARRRRAAVPWRAASGSGIFQRCPPLDLFSARSTLSSDTKYTPCARRQPARPIDVAAGPPAPVDDAVLGVQAVEEVVLRSDEEPIVDCEDLVGRAAEAPLPDWARPCRRAARRCAVAARQVDAVAGERGLRMSGRAEIAAPDQHAVGRAKGEDVAAGRERRASRCPRRAAPRALPASGSCQATVPSAARSAVSAPGRTTKTRSSPAAGSRVVCDRRDPELRAGTRS